jgi:hypothetical protein
VPNDGDADVFEVISSQLRQKVGRNLVLLERLFVALQPQLSQPRQDIHGVPDQTGQAGFIRTTTRAPPTRGSPNATRSRTGSSSFGRT